jgi:toxin-antitoxin system PIN domain toxin
MFVVDTNVLLHAVNRDAPEHREALALLIDWRGRHGAWFLTWGIAYEFLRVVTHSRVLPRPLTGAQASAWLATLLQSPGLAMLTPGERHAQVLQEVLRDAKHITGNLWHDAHTVALMREHGVHRVVSHNQDFRRFPGIELLAPADLL